MPLLDVNVWLALTFDSHDHHPAAKAWFDGLSNELCYFCRLTQQGFLRLATNPRVFGEHALNLTEAWRNYDAYLNDPRVAFLEEPLNVETLWRSYTQSDAFMPSIWNDAFLAAFAEAAKIGLVTFDKGFAKYKNVPCTILT